MLVYEVYTVEYFTFIFVFTQVYLCIPELTSLYTCILVRCYIYLCIPGVNPCICFVYLCVLV